MPVPSHRGMSYTPGRTDGRENQSQIERERGRGVTTTTHNTHIYEENTQKGQVSYPSKKEKKMSKGSRHFQ